MDIGNLKSSLEDLVEKCYDSPFREFLISEIEPAIELQKTDFLKSSLSSKIGGLPLLEVGEKWPRCKIGNPYHFVLQINLADAKDLKIKSPLPNNGILSFYFSSNDWEDGIVKYHDDLSILKTAKLPKEFSEEVARNKLPFYKRIFTSSNLFKVYEEFGLIFKVNYHIPSYDSVQVELFSKNNGLRIHDFILDEMLVEKTFLGKPSNGFHHLFGYYLGRQESKYELRSYNKKWFQEDKFQLSDYEEATRWKLLLNLRSDRDTKMNWVDAGNLYFFIHEDDLEKNIYKNIRAYLDTT